MHREHAPPLSVKASPASKNPSRQNPQQRCIACISSDKRGVEERISRPSVSPAREAQPSLFRENCTLTASFKRNHHSDTDQRQRRGAKLLNICAKSAHLCWRSARIAFQFKEYDRWPILECRRENLTTSDPESDAPLQRGISDNGTSLRRGERRPPESFPVREKSRLKPHMWNKCPSLTECFDDPRKGSRMIIRNSQSCILPHFSRCIPL